MSVATFVGAHVERRHSSDVPTARRDLPNLGSPPSAFPIPLSLVGVVRSQVVWRLAIQAAVNRYAGLDLHAKEYTDTIARWLELRTALELEGPGGEHVARCVGRLFPIAPCQRCGARYLGIAYQMRYCSNQCRRAAEKEKVA